MYLDMDFKALPWWADARWAGWAVNPDASPEARTSLDRLLALNLTRRRLSWVTVPLAIAKYLAAFVVAMGMLALLFIVFIRSLWGMLTGNLTEGVISPELLENQTALCVFVVAAIGISCHGVLWLILGPIDRERTSLITQLTVPEIQALRPTPGIDGFKVPRAISDELAWETAALLVELDAAAEEAKKLNEQLPQARDYHLSTEELRIHQDRQEAYDQARARQMALATQIADAFYSADVRTCQEPGDATGMSRR